MMDVTKLAGITDPEEMVEFLEDSLSSYRQAAKPKTRMEYAVLFLLWSLVFTITGIGASYWYGILTAFGVIS
jgi:hypothetical protein